VGLNRKNKYVIGTKEKKIKIFWMNEVQQQTQSIKEEAHNKKTNAVELALLVPGTCRH
jgi:hypothetical protein